MNPERRAKESILGEEDKSPLLQGESPEKAHQKEQKERDEYDAAIVEHNINKMGSDMNKVLSSESIGSNAGMVEIDGVKYSCVAVNGYADPDIGKIIVFGNPQNMNEHVLRHNAHFSFKIALSPKGKIVDFTYRAKAFSNQAATNLLSAVDEYNEKLGT